MMNEKAIVRGDVFDRVGKSVLIVLLSAMSVATAFFSFMKTGKTVMMIMWAVACASAVILTFIRGKVSNSWKSVPMSLFTATYLVGFLKEAATLTKTSDITHSVTVMIIAIIATVKMLNMRDETKKGIYCDPGYDSRFYLLLLVLIDMLNSTYEAFANNVDPVIVADYLSRLFLVQAILILCLPSQGFLNIRRIAITFGRFASIGIFTFGMIKILSSRITAISGTNALAAIAAVFISLITILCCMEPKKEPEIEADGYDYSPGEKLLKAIGWCNAEEERVNRRRYLKSAAKRDFVHEYAHRFYNDMYYAKDIASIQQNLRSINQQIEDLAENANGQNRIKAASLETEGADLLGKLCIVYDFNTGINECPKELMHTHIMDADAGKND